jgi:guanine deaminase
MTRLVCGEVVSFSADGGIAQHHPQGAVAIDGNGRIDWIGPRSAMPTRYASAAVDDHQDCLVMPGLIDAHIHFPQYRMLAAPGKDLLDWLTRFTFPEESRFASSDHAAASAEIFLDLLLASGTTSALAFCSVHKACAEALFSAAGKRNMALVTGKTMMDRNAIPAVQDDPETGARESEELYRKWHGKGRLRYAVTPRFAVTSSESQLKLSGDLLRSLPDALMQSHLSESPGEIAFVKQLFPAAKDYTDVYDKFGLLGPRSLFAHGVHLSERECQRLSESGSTVVHCATSNNFLGSGLMSMLHMRRAGRPVQLGIATDVGGGTSYSMLATMGETYKVQMLTGYKPTAAELFAMSTIGNAERLHIAAETGSLVPGKFADLVVLDPEATRALRLRNQLSGTLEEKLFALIIMGDDRAVASTYVAGERLYSAQSA